MDKNLQKIYVPQNDIWGKYQIFKNIKFYPIKLKDIREQELFYHIFSFPKNYIPDKKILKMSYLKYLIYVIQYAIDPNGKQIANELIEFLKYCTKENDVSFVYSKNELITNMEDISNLVLINIKIKDQIFTEQDFDVIRGIILKQNGLSIEYIEEFNPELEEFLSYSESGELKGVSLEDEIFTFAALLNKTVEEIGECTLYQFKKLLPRLIHLLDYKLYQPLEVSGQIKAKNGGKIVKHYMMHMGDQSRYESILIPKEKFLSDNPDFPDETGKVKIPKIN